MSQIGRIVVLDTETTGQRPAQGDRIVEIGAVELIDGVPTGKTYHQYLNPEGKRNDEGALRVHGLTDEFLSKQKKFKEIYPEFLQFIKGAEMVIHNADFDTGFLNAELARLNLGLIWDHCGGVTCSYKMAQSKYIGQRAGLDALCKRLGVDNSHRTLHGALLDAELLSEVYIIMVKDGIPYVDDEARGQVPRGPIERVDGSAFSFASVAVPADNLAAHEAFLDAIEAETKKPSLWRSNEQLLPADATRPAGPRM
jgi:DNA polymerase III subunit epsilon